MLLKGHISDKQILEKIKEGNSLFFEYLYRRYKGKVYNFILSLSNGDFYLAEDIVQNVFLRIWEIRKEINVDQPISPFLYTVSRNMFLNTVKKKALEWVYQMTLLEKKEECTNPVEEEVEYKLLEQEINRLIDMLPPARKRIYQLSRQQLFSNKEIAKMLSISENTVESNLYKANSFIKKFLISHYGGELFTLILLTGWGIMNI